MIEPGGSVRLYSAGVLLSTEHDSFPEPWEYVI